MPSYYHSHVKQSIECQYQDLLHMPSYDMPILYFMGKFSREYTPLNSSSFWFFCISKLVKVWRGTKNTALLYSLLHLLFSLFSMLSLIFPNKLLSPMYLIWVFDSLILADKLYAKVFNKDLHLANDNLIVLMITLKLI